MRACALEDGVRHAEDAPCSGWEAACERSVVRVVDGEVRPDVARERERTQEVAQPPDGLARLRGGGAEDEERLAEDEALPEGPQVRERGLEE
jgi:hypothetical protein